MQGIDLTSTYQKISKKLEAILISQAPVDSGRLKNSIAVTFDEQGFKIYDPTNYGMYLHAGTGREKDSAATNNPATTYANLINKKWNPRPGEGKEGIKPTYWMNFSESVYMMIEQEIEKVLTRELEEGITKALNQ